MLYYSYTQTFSLILLHCWYSSVCHFVRSLKAFVCQEIKGLHTYLLTYNWISYLFSHRCNLISYLSSHRYTCIS